MSHAKFHIKLQEELKKSIDLNLNSLYDIAEKRITMTK